MSGKNPSRYAEGTSVPVERSKAEIEHIVVDKHGATKFLTYWTEEYAIVMFEVYGRLVRFVLPMPSRDEFIRNNAGRKRKPEAQRSAFEAEVRRIWRVMVLLIKAKFELVDNKVTSFEEEFLANIVLPDNTTVADWMAPQLQKAFEKGSMPIAFLEHRTGGPKP